jgi:hypothetical protein
MFDDVPPGTKVYIFKASGHKTAGEFVGLVTDTRAGRYAVI